MTERATGLYEAILTDGLAAALTEVRGVHARPLGDGEAPRFLARHLHGYLVRALSGVDPDERIAVVNQLLEALGGVVAGFVDLEEDRVRASLLTAVWPGPARVPERPGVPLSESALFVNAKGERSLGSELRRELQSADRVDLICAFLFWTGFVTLQPGLRAFCERGGQLRVISTPYRGVTEARVLRELAAMGAEVRIAYDITATRLHAKAWLFHRDSGYSTAYVGSSNMSKSALHSGLEWNVRLSAIENRAVIDEFRAVFDGYWHDADFEPYDDARFADARADAKPSRPLLPVYALHPKPFQRVILETLDARRRENDQHRNLIVAATGTGKTVVAALDYARLCTPGKRPTLLFVAHRREILEQAQRTWRNATSDASFGELLVGGDEPREWRHVFASIQSLRTRRDKFTASHFQVVVVDEFHHSEARTYTELLDWIEPEELLGLTATPERADGLDVLRWFDGRVAAEIRLWDAIDRGLLVPFQYFVLHDAVPLDQVSWRGGRYDAGALDRLYTGHHIRAHVVAKAVESHVSHPHAMRAIGFCAGVEHAKFMAQAFERLGLKAACLTGETAATERRRMTAELQSDRPDRICALFTVDVFNEGVDLPAVDTVLFLRPTESPTVFLQQLGRGLRRWAGKRCLTVLDFVGQPRREFRFDRKLRALAGGSRRRLAQQVEADFPFLPAGCSLQFDRASREIVLDNLRSGLGRNDRRSLVDELRAVGDVGLSTFLQETELELADIYRKRAFADLRRAAGFEVLPAGPDEDALGRALSRLIHVDDSLRLETWRGLVSRAAPPPPAKDKRSERLRLMLSTALFGGEATAPSDLDRLWAHPALRRELVELIDHLRSTLSHTTLPFADAPLRIHGRYSLAEVMAAFGDVRGGGRLYAPREGVVFHQPSQSNLLFVTLRKDEDDYSPSTMYRDYALAPDRFHWQSQSRTRPTDTKGRRHVEHADLGVTPLLFVRATKKDDRGETLPYAFLGPVELLAHAGERPMNIEWRLAHPMGAALFQEASVVRG